VTELAIQYGELQRTVADLHATHGELARGKGRLHESCGSYLGTGWTGAAADSFRDGWSTWAEGVDDVLDALGSMGELLTENARAFRSDDSLTGSSIDRLHHRLGDAT
jgi:WXG100 family type VII secretion target